jgi:hypothetical protein
LDKKESRYDKIPLEEEKEWFYHHKLYLVFHVGVFAVNQPNMTCFSNETTSFGIKIPQINS